MTTYRVSYLNYKGRPSSCFIHAKTEKEAWETASVMQGIEALQEAQARWENSIHRTTSIREEFYDRESWFGTPWKIEYTFRYSASYSEVLK